MPPGAWMEQEIREQPSLLRAQASRYEDELRSAMGGLRPQLVVLAARGSSDHAALYARYLIEIFLQIPVSLAAPSVLTRYRSEVRYPPCLIVGISQSGAAPDVGEVLESARNHGHSTLAVTNSPASRVASAAEHALLLDCGPERSVAATKTYTASLLAMGCLVRALGGELPPMGLPDEAWLDRSRSAAEAALGPVLRSNRWFALGRGLSFASAHETALKLMECALVPCKAYSTADFQHGPRALATHGSTALVFGQPPERLEAQGCAVERFPDPGHGPWSPIAEIMTGQWLALLAARAKGLDPDQPDHLTKVTRTL
ncbi:MAG: SIS domain-containing protein [Fimbriimonadaceae bacterium]|nr:MAG: SIS domain-containing protein [Fimbriimonadaceae bacterium]